MHHNDLARDGVYVDGKLLKSVVTSIHIDTSFMNATVTGNVNAGPLYLAGSGSNPDEVIVATERNNVYAFNAATGAQRWMNPAGTPVTSGLPCGNINPLGVTGTPVIDGATRTIYLDAMTADSTATAKHMIHALNADTGAEVTGWPVDVNATASSGGTSFSSVLQNQRSALTLVGGKVFVTYSGHVGDCGGYHGWVVGVTTSGTPQVTSWATRAIAGGIWGSSGIASDGTSLFFATGNTKSSAANPPPFTTPGQYGDGETVYKFPTSLAAPSMSSTTDLFVPSDWMSLDTSDADIGGTNPVIFSVPGATPANLLMALGKNGNAYLLNRASLGGFQVQPMASLSVSSTDIINAAAVYRTATATYVVFRNGNTQGAKGVGCPAQQASGGLSAIRVNAGSPPTMAVAWCGGPSAVGSPAVSMTDTNGTNAIVWAVGSDNKLYAIDGDSGATLATSAAMSTVAAIQTPIVTGGRIFVASNTQVYALTP
jgi:outer membrane protein assembly factor BamB